MARRALLVLILAFAAALGLASPAMAQEAGATLSPGEFVWYDDPALTKADLGPVAPVAIVVSIPAQRAYIYRDGVLIGVSTVSTGRPGKETPIGEFTVLEKQVFHRSNKYSGAPMPWMQRLTWDGIAMHAGQLPGYPASHGCIRLPAAFARQLYELTRVGVQVSVIDEDIAVPLDTPMASIPKLFVNTATLGGDSFNVVTVASVRGDEATMTPATWITGPSVEIVQPIPANAH